VGTLGIAGVSTMVMAEAPEDAPAPPDARQSFVRWGVAAYLGAVAALVAAVLVWLHGRFVYVIDDPVIHLSVADKLVHHGTWGVSAGSFESASSSPLWTVLVAAGLVVTPAGAESWVPLALNVVFGVAVVVLLGRAQAVLAPGRGRPVDIVATAVVVVVALFLPGLAVVGMEHTLQVLLVLAAVVAFQRRSAGEPVPGPAWLPYLLIALATLTRFETAFVAAGLAAGMALDGPGSRVGGGLSALREALAARWRPIVGVLAATAVPTVAFAVLNHALGGGFLPNSVLAKGQGGRAGSSHADRLGPTQIVNNLAKDPLLVVLVGLALAYLVVTWGRPAAHRLTAVTLVVAAGLHAELADVGWYERYQAYLIAIGVYLVLGILSEVPSESRRRGLVAVVALVGLFGTVKAGHMLRAPQAADDMYRQQYQAGRFLERYYDGQPVATDQLGYISYFHDGPLTDFAGLGDYEVLQRTPTDRRERRELWAELTDERGFDVAVVYDIAALTVVPDTWVLGGTLHIDGEPTTGVTSNLQIWSTSLDDADVRALIDHLEEFAPDLPAREELVVNEYAGFQAAARRDRLALEQMAKDADDGTDDGADATG
jgi:hypothetical protein